MAEGAGAQEEQAQTHKNKSEKSVFRAGILCRLQIEIALLRRQIAQTQSGILPLRQLQGRQRELHDSFYPGCSLGNDREGSGCGFGGFCACHESVFLYMQKQKCGEFQKKRQQELKLSMESSRKRIADLDKLFSRIYEDNVIGKLSDERYARMAAEYESEQKELLEKVKEEEKQLSEMEQKSVDMHLLLQGLREFTDMKELTPTIVNKLIRRIEVHNPEKKHARKSVKVDIYFTAMGLVSLPDEQEIRRMMEQMRSASQIPKQLTA